MIELKADMNITEIDKYKKRTEQHFHDGTQTEYNNTLANQTINIQIQQHLKLFMKKVNENIQSTTKTYTFFMSVTEKSEEYKTI